MHPFISHKIYRFVFLALSILLLSFKNREVALIGSTISDFTLPNVDGTLFSSKAVQNVKGFIVVFTCNHCPFAKLYTNRLNALNQKYAPLNYPLIAINSMDTVVYEDESFELMQQRAKTEKYTFPYLHDSMQSVVKQFKAGHTPQAFIIVKEENEWKVKYSGAIDDNGAEPNKVKNSYIEKAMNEIILEKQVSQPETESFGCAIFYRK